MSEARRLLTELRRKHNALRGSNGSCDCDACCVIDRYLAQPEPAGREALEHIFVTAEERVSLFPADGYWISVRDTAALAIDALAQPEPAAREAAATQRRRNEG